MSQQLERHTGVKLSFWVSRELLQKIRDYQHAQKMKTLSEGEIDLLEKGLLPHSEASGLSPCNFRSLRPRDPDFFNCKKGTYSKAFTRTVRLQDCVDCQKKIENWPLEKQYNDLLQHYQSQNQIIRDLKDRIAELENRPVISKPAIHSESAPTPTYEKLPQNSQQVKRVIEENRTRKTTEFVTSPEPKTVQPDILCPKTADFVSVDGACKKCDSIPTCRPYEEFFMLKRAIRNQ